MRVVCSADVQEHAFLLDGRVSKAFMVVFYPPQMQTVSSSIAGRPGCA